jgi:hypothetical protein
VAHKKNNTEYDGDVSEVECRPTDRATADRNPKLKKVGYGTEEYAIYQVSERTTKEKPESNRQ